MAKGKLGAVDISTGAGNVGTDVLLFTAAADQTFNVRFCNRSAVDVKVRAAIGTGGSPAAADWVDYDLTVKANKVLEDTGLVASSGEKVWVRSNLTDVSVRAFGV